MKTPHLVLLWLALCGCLHAAETPAPVPASAAPAVVAPTSGGLPSVELLRDKEVVQRFAALPVLESGRIKPLETLASYRLLRFRSKRSIPLTQNGESRGEPLVDPVTQKPLLSASGKPLTLKPTEWLLLCWFRPDIAKTVPLFKVDNSSAIAELGLPPKAKRDQYSFLEIDPARKALLTKLQQYREIPEKKQTPEQRMIVQLAMNFLDFEMIADHFNFIRAPFGPKPEALPPGVESPIRLSKSLPAVLAFLRTSSTPPMQIPWFRPLGQSALSAIMSGRAEQQLRIFPPIEHQHEVWHGPGETLLGALQSQKDPEPEQLSWLALYEDVFLALPDPAQFKKAAAAFLSKVQDAAQRRNEARFVSLEQHLNRADYFFRAQWIFLVGFLTLALSWVSPGSRLEKITRALSWTLLSCATVLAVTCVIVRCIIMQRPPITVLYETILFIGASIALFGLLAEWIAKRGLGLLVAAVGGTACMFLAIQFEASEATDTLQQLQAVLITNFWLSTHVPLINLGYAACMVAALISMVYFLKRLAGRLSPRSDDARFLTRAAYGFIAAGLFLSLVGTVLGGIWANYSWGRFWGWDPKENGALMIVLMCLVILHARLGGYLAEVGIHCANLILGCVVVFSWFGVNQLGVGLHAYGFTDGTWPKIYAFWLSQLLLLGYGIYLSFRDRSLRASESES